MVSKTLFVAILSSSTGKNFLLGSPPAKEIIVESIVTFSISRIKDRGTSAMRSENILSINILLYLISLKISENERALSLSGRALVVYVI
jgi:hypothetical protein